MSTRGDTVSLSSLEDDEEMLLSDHEGDQPSASNVHQQISKEEVEIERLQQEILRAKETHERNATRSRIVELKEARQTRKDLEKELQDIMRLQEGERPFIKEPTAKRRRTNTKGQPSDSLANPRRSGVKISAMPPYKGKSIQEAQAFIRGAERRFEQDKGYYYSTDNDKITFCVLAFEHIPEQKWTTYEEEAGPGNITWEEFKDFLLESIRDKDNRIFDAADKYEGAVQREGQSIDDFVTYLDTLERDLGVTDDTQRLRTLFAKLQPDLKAEVTRRNEVPKDRKSLISLARRIETTEKVISSAAKRGKKEVRANSVHLPRHTRSSLDHRFESPQTMHSQSIISDANRTPVGGATKSNRRDVKCFRCKGKGHSSRECPEVECYKCKRKGHISPNCPESRNAGNGQAHS